jgi:hydroxypyruvate reductase
MERPEASQLIRPLSTLREHLTAILRAAIDAADAGVLVARALEDADVATALQRAIAIDVIAVGKAARPMAAAFSSRSGVTVRSELVIGPADAGHPLPDERSAAAAERALAAAGAATAQDLLVVLLSGGASSLMALPRSPLTLDPKRHAIQALLARGADIGELNTVRKHLSAIKGGQLAAACGAPVLTLAISDVVGDDLTVIGSGPTVADPSTFHDALAVLDVRGGRARYPPEVVSVLEHGAAGQTPETPKPGAPWFMRSAARIIGTAAHALAGARRSAAALGYHVRVIDEPVVGEARVVASAHVKQVAKVAWSAPRPLCVLSSGETTVRVTGRGSGGRNQELALAMAPHLAVLGSQVAAASVGTDGVDGPTDAAGAFVDATSLARAREMALAPERYLEDNNTYEFFRALDDLIVIGPTNTNVGDIQVVLIHDA